MVQKVLAGLWATCVLAVLLPALGLGTASGLTVNLAANASTPYTGTAIPLPGAVRSENFDNGGEGLAYHDASPDNSGGAYRSTGVDVQPSNPTGFNIGWTANGEWLAYTVNVAASGSYRLQFQVASPNAVGRMHARFGAADTAIVAIPNTGGWQTWTTVAVTANLTAGPQVMKVVFDVGGFNLGGMTATLVAPSIVESTPYTGTAIPLPGAVRTENFDNGGEGVAYHDASPGNSGGVYRSTAVDIQAKNPGGYNIGWTADGEWLAYTVNAATSGLYLLQFQVASPAAVGRMHARFGSADTATIAIPNTGGWQSWTTVAVQANLTAGRQLMKVVFDVGGFNLAGITATFVPPPAVPVAQTPPNGATGVATATTLGWTAGGATSNDVRFGTTNPPAAIATGLPGASYTPSGLTNGTTYFWQVIARNDGGTTAGPVLSFTTAAPLTNGDIVIYASDIPASGRHGSWTTAADASSPNAIKLVTPDNGVANVNNPLASPVDYVDVTFSAPAGTPYRIWMRMQAAANSKYNDAVWLQFSDATAGGSPIYQVGTTSGLLVNLATDAGATSLNRWGWQNTAYWLTQPTTVSFATSGTHTVRVQVREDGVQFDQIVLSPSVYLNASPGLLTNDNTIVSSSVTLQPPSAPASPNPVVAATGVSTAPALTWSAAGAVSYDVRFGTSNPPADVATGQANAAYSPAQLANGATYFWQIVARNAAGATTGPVWAFNTMPSGGNSGTTWNVPAGGDLQAAINNARPGDTILLQAGATFSGNFVLPAKAGNAFITIRSSASDAQLPGPNTRVTPAYAALLPKLKSPTVEPALRTDPGAHHYRLMFLEFPPTYQGYYDIMRLGDGSDAQNTLSMVPYELVLDHIYMHGDPIYGQKRGIALNSASTTITNSYIAGIKAIGQDSQAIAGVNGPGPFTIVNNYLEAAGENIIFGGSDPAIPNLVPSDIVVRGNHLYKPLAWRSQPQWTLKNLFELKNAQRVVVDGNIMENNWEGGQSGYAVLFTVRNQDGGCPWCVVQDVQFTNNIVRNASGGFNILGRDNNHPSLETNNIVVRNNLFENISGAQFGGQGRFLMMNGGGHDYTFDHNTVLQDGWTMVYAGDPIQNFVFTNNIGPDYSWAVMGDGQAPGNATIAVLFPYSMFRGNIFAGSNPSTYPAGNHYPASLAAVGFVNYVPLAGGNYRLALTSLFRNAGNDGKDVGVDIDAMNLAAGTSY
jgi:hypothetical protein